MLLLLFSGYRISKYANKKYKFGDKSCRLCLWMVMFIDIKYKSCLTNSINLLQFFCNISLLLLKCTFLLRFQWYIMLNFLFSLLLFDILRYSLLPLFYYFTFSCTCLVIIDVPLYLCLSLFLGETYVHFSVFFTNVICQVV